MEENRPNPRKPGWYSAAQASSIGFEILASLGVGYFLGKWLDGKFHTKPWLTIVFFLAGVGAAIKAMVRLVREYKREFPN